MARNELRPVVGPRPAAGTGDTHMARKNLRGTQRRPPCTPRRTDALGRRNGRVGAR
ncbi:hypothetical protein [Streptomyces sp. TS71-3]|uniref:hypothetical protein n=1 Tax=Streptomyces sp. TS71-3 TaxID=2733862 RepID=UPI001B227564|nr:hypothetical protein [Streptomyces sp. TS71-3]GHJ39374.1 hypothetical protein Sm713_49830 [Streptomyces sp. TS71-3]